jgi:two-component system, LuxR family, sensor kinase FixL
VEPAVLIIEDDRGNRESLRRILKLDGYRVDAAECFADAFARENWADYFAVLLDRKLPDGTADEWLPRLREQAPEAGLIIITAFVDLDGAIAAIRHGAHDYLIKPIDGDDVRTRLRRLAEHRATKDALIATEDRLRTVLSTASDAIVTFDADGIIRHANPATSRLTGFAAADLPGLSLDTLLPGAEAAQSVDTRFHHRQSLSDTSHDAIVRHKDGSFIPIDLAVSPMGDGRLFTGIIRDMSQRRELQKEVLDSAEEERRRIGGDLHDALGQHLTGITYLAETLQKQVSDADAEAARLAGRISELLKETIEQTRRLVRGLYPVDPRPDGLRDALTSLAKRLEEDFHVTAAFECPDEFVFNDSNAANHLYRIAQEACSNAVRHGGAKQLKIRVVRDEHWMHLMITDEGGGFELDDSPAAGLGLRLMRYRAGLIGGRLSVNSEPEVGTSVVCTIPRPADAKT